MSQRTALVQKLLLAGWLTLGTVVVWLSLAMVALWFVQELRISSRVEEQVHFLADGTPAIITIHFDRPNFNLRTLDGRPLTVPNDEPTPPAVRLEGPVGRRRPGQRGWSEYVVSFVETTKQGPNWFSSPNWFFLHDADPLGTGYFVGYNPISKRHVGNIGRLGFRSDPPPRDEQFAVDGRITLTTYSNAVGRDPDAPNWLRPRTAGFAADVIHLLSEGHLYEVDLTRHTVRDAWPDGDLVSLDLAQEALPTGHTSRSWLVLRTRDRVVWHGEEPGDERSFILPPELRGVHMDLNLAADGTVIAEFDRERSLHVSTVQLCRFDTAGKVTERTSAALEDHGAALVSRRADPYILAALSPGTLPGAGIAFLSTENMSSTDGAEIDVGSRLRRALRENWPQLLLQIVISACMSLVCRRRQQRYAQRGTWAWMAFVLIFGVPGWLGYLWHRRWPALAACPACGRAVPRDR
ncbi:MAG TPA: hypothetical protein VMV69_22685 [Pirellulales bacterium]|nr:hypothetical protein [Pirellulales bacterium]